MWEFIGYVIGIVLLIAGVILVLATIIACIAVGLVIGVFPAIYTSVKTYFISINDEITNPFIKWALFVSVGLGVLCIIIPLVAAVVWLIAAIV